MDLQALEQIADLVLGADFFSIVEQIVDVFVPLLSEILVMILLHLRQEFTTHSCSVRLVGWMKISLRRHAVLPISGWVVLFL